MRVLVRSGHNGPNSISARPVAETVSKRDPENARVAWWALTVLGRKQKVLIASRKNAPLGRNGVRTRSVALRVVLLLRSVHESVKMATIVTENHMIKPSVMLARVLRGLIGQCIVSAP